jgi:putative transposase
VNKAEKIKRSLQETKERRKGQRPVVFQLKLQNLSKKKEEDLRRAFLEAKWLYNWLVSDTQRLDLPANKVQEVEVKVRDGFENRELLLLGSQVKQEIADRLRDNLGHPEKRAWPEPRSGRRAGPARAHAFGEGGRRTDLGV